MAFFSPKTWKQRIVEFPGRRRLDDTSTADVYDVSRAEGIVTQEGDGFTAVNMNDLEQRINNAVNDVAGLSADEYDPNATYSSGDLRIHDNILHKASQDISVAEPWTPAHWDATTIAAELKAQAEYISDLNSSINSKATYIYLDDSSVVNDPIGVVKNRWSDIADGVYIADIMCGGRFCALVQRVNGGQYGAVYAIGYGIEQPAYGRCIGGSWS